MKKIFAITVNYNRNDSTIKLIDSLKTSETPGFMLEIIVVDNSLMKTLKPKDKSVTVIGTDKNTGFSGGCNIGIREAFNRGADYILLVNNDAVIMPNMIKNLKEVLDSGPKIGITTPKIYFAKGREFHKDRYKKGELGHVLWFAGGINDWNNARSIHRGVDLVDTGQFDKAEKVDFATGCCMMVKREVFEKAGFFDERYFLYYEDHDLCERVKRCGYEIYFVPDAVMYHDNASSSGSGSELHDYFLTRNQMLFGMSYAPLKTKLALLRQSLRLLVGGRRYQEQAIKDFYLKKLGKGTFFGK